ncbi:hypothetical protein V499_00421 [Pseudogymnoascus sp. VKM F-103]|nr:hypothetical protein V499_00421 [Pseudogymnoascus sp. VKM F-103]
MPADASTDASRAADVAEEVDEDEILAILDGDEVAFGDAIGDDRDEYFIPGPDDDEGSGDDDDGEADAGPSSSSDEIATSGGGAEIAVEGGANPPAASHMAPAQQMSDDRCKALFRRQVEISNKLQLLVLALPRLGGRLDGVVYGGNSAQGDLCWAAIRTSVGSDRDDHPPVMPSPPAQLEINERYLDVPEIIRRFHLVIEVPEAWRLITIREAVLFISERELPRESDGSFSLTNGQRANGLLSAASSIVRLFSVVISWRASTPAQAVIGINGIPAVLIVVQQPDRGPERDVAAGHDGHEDLSGWVIGQRGGKPEGRHCAGGTEEWHSPTEAHPSSHDQRGKVAEGEHCGWLARRWRVNGVRV